MIQDASEVYAKVHFIAKMDAYPLFGRVTVTQADSLRNTGTSA
jgi:hypothetical protein